MRSELELQTIRVVRAIAETGSITAAASRLGFSQPALTQQLQKAEARLGMPLVTRAGRGVRLTDAGQLLARHAVVIASALDAAAEELAELSGLRTGTARVAAFPSASSTIVPEVLRAMRQRHPGIAVSYVEAEPPEAISLLREGAIDLAITFSYPGDPSDPHRNQIAGLDIAPLFMDAVQLVLPADHPRASASAIRPSELAADRWIAGCPLCRGHLLALCRADGFEPDIEHQTDNAVAVLHLVASGLGVALLPRLALQTATVPAGVVVRSTAPESSRAIQLVGLTGVDRVPSVAAAARVIREIATT